MTEIPDELRVILLQAALSELCRIDVDRIKSPACPRCGYGPEACLPSGQAFCGNDDCQVFTWQITDTAEEFEANARPVRMQTRNPDGTWQDVEPED